MKSTKLFKWLSLVIILAMLLAACQPAATETTVPEPTTAAEPTTAPEPTAVPEKTEEVVETEEVMEPCAPAKDGTFAGVDPRGVTVEWWHNHSGSREEKLLPLVQKFNDTNECGITVNAANQGSYDDIRDKVNAGLATGELPGLVVGYQNDQAFYQLADGLVDLQPYMEDAYWGIMDEYDDYFESFILAGRHPAYDNQQLGFPPNRSVEGLFYNISWLKDLGFDGTPPTTPDDFYEMACAAAEANGDGTGGYILRDDASAVAAWTYAFGGDILTEDGTGYVYNGEATVKAMEFIKKLYDDGCAYFFSEGFPNPEFAARRALFTSGSSSGLPFYAGDIATFAAENNKTADEWGFAAIPHTTADPVMNVYGGDVMIPSTTPEIQLASWVFIKWFTSPETQAEWVKISNYFPTRASSSDFLGDFYTQNPQFAQATELLKYGYFEPQLISYQSVRDAASAAFNEIMQGADIQATLDTLTTTANELQAELSE